MIPYIVKQYLLIDVGAATQPVDPAQETSPDPADAYQGCRVHNHWHQPCSFCLGCEQARTGLQLTAVPPDADTTALHSDQDCTSNV